MSRKHTLSCISNTSKFENTFNRSLLVYWGEKKKHFSLLSWEIIKKKKTYDNIKNKYMPMKYEKSALFKGKKFSYPIDKHGSCFKHKLTRLIFQKTRPIMFISPSPNKCILNLRMFRYLNFENKTKILRLLMQHLINDFRNLKLLAQI